MGIFRFVLPEQREARRALVKQLGRRQALKRIKAVRRVEKLLGGFA